MKEKITRVAIYINLFLIGVQFLIIISVWNFLPPEIPLFYSRPWGIEQLATHPNIVILPSISLIILFTNTFLAQLVIKEEILIKEMLLLTSLIFSFLILIALIQIIRLVT